MLLLVDDKSTVGMGKNKTDENPGEKTEGSVRDHVQTHADQSVFAVRLGVDPQPKAISFPGVFD